MDIENTIESPDATRKKLLTAAHRQFADRGFYGASIAQIAGEVGLTKQALLYHFKRKEELYTEVLRQISERLVSAMRKGEASGSSPATAFEGMIIALYNMSQVHPLDTKLLMRELIDNQRSEASPKEWHIKSFLDGIVRSLDKVAGLAERPFAEKFAGLYSIISAIEYFSASNAVLTRFYGEKEYIQIAQAYPHELRAQVQRLISSGRK